VPPPTPLHLALEPLLPTRTPNGGGWFEYGFHLRLPDGPRIDRADPLLAAYGARVVTVAIHADDDEPLQDAGFDPGSIVRLVPDTGDDGDAEVGVWDADELRLGGSLIDRAAEIVTAAVDCGLEQTAIVLTEDRAADDDRRNGLDLVVFHAGFVEIDVSAAASFERPARRSRPRLVLVADGRGDVRWWDPSASTGPIAADALPMSAELRRDLEGLRASYEELADSAGEARGFDRIDMSIERYSLNERATALWKRARTELGRRFAIGFLGAGMERPVWSPSELSDDDEDDDGIPF
jgi:hypothetical protein